MASRNFKSNHRNEVFHGFGLLCFLLLIHKACGREFLVGGSKGWTAPSEPQSYNQWAERNRFQIGDSVLFVYPLNQDSVLQVTSDAYASCNTHTPTAKFTDGHTSFTFNQSGPHYFISGNKDNCLKNEKLMIIVMADRGNLSPPPSSPSPAPSGEEPPSPPESGTVDLNPTPAPSQESRPNAASSVFVSLIGFVGATLTSSLLLAF